MGDKLGDAVIEILIKDLKFEQKMRQAMDRMSMSAKLVGQKINDALGKKRAATIAASATAITTAGKRAAAVTAQQTAQVKAQTKAISANASAQAKSVVAVAAANAAKTRNSAAVNAIRQRASAAAAAAVQKMNSLSASKGLLIKLNQRGFNQQLSQIAQKHAQSIANMQAKSELVIRLRRQREAVKSANGDGGGGFLQGAGAVAAGQILATGLMRASEAAKDLVTQGIMYNAQLQRMETGFTQMLGSQRRAKALLAETRSYAAKTPFEMPDITDVAVKLLATKKIAQSEVMPVIRKLGDAAAGSANGFQSLPHITKAITDMLGKGVIHAQEMNQLAEAGIPAWSMLAESMGVSEATARKMSEEGKVGMAQVMGLIDKLGDRYKGMAEAQSRTFLGMASTIKDNVGMALGDAFKPLFEGAVKAMAYVVRVMDGKNFAGFITSIQSAMSKVMSIIESIVSSPLAMFVVKVGTVAAGIITAVGAASLLSTALAGVAAAISPIIIPVTAAVAGVTLLSTLIQRAFDGPYARSFARHIDGIKTGVMEIGRNIMSGIAPALKSVGDTLGGIFGKTGGMQAGFNSFLNGVLKGLKNMVNFMSVLSADWGGAWDYIQAKAAAVAITIWEEFKYTLNERIPFAVAAMVDGTIAGFLTLVNNGEKIFSAFGNLIIGIFKSVVESIKLGFAAAMAIIQVQLKAAAEAWEQVKQGKLGDAANTVVTGQKDAAALGKQFLRDALNEIKDPINTFSSDLQQVSREAGKNAMDAFKGTLSAMPPRVASTMEKIAHDLAAKIFGANEKKRDDSRRADKMGALFSGLLGSLKGKAGALGDSAKGWLDDIGLRFQAFQDMFKPKAREEGEEKKRENKTDFVGIEQMNKRLQESLSGSEEKKDRKAAVKATLDVKEETRKVGLAVGAAVATGAKTTVAAISGLAKSIGFGD